MRFSFEQLESFHAAVETGSFSAAARKLGKAQSRVSTAIANLEADLGVTLFDRSGKYPVLTCDGELLLARASDVLKQCGVLLGQADRLAAGRQVLLRVAFDELLSSRFVADVLEAFAETFPSIEVEVLWGAMGDVTGIVTSGRADVGVEMPCSVQPPVGCTWRVLASTDFCGVVSPDHPLAALSKISPNDLTPYRQVLAVSREGNRLPEAFRFGGHLWQCEDSGLIRELIRRGLAWAALPRYQIATDLKRGTMVELPMLLGESGFVNTFYFIWDKNRQLTEAEEWIAEKVSSILNALCSA